MIIKTISKEEALAFAPKIDILIVTATSTETKALHEALQPLDGCIYKVAISAFTYFVAKLGKYAVVHIQSKAGSSSSGGSSVSVSSAIRFWDPKAIFMVGIAFGASKKKQKIGDLLISEGIYPYEISRLGQFSIIDRGGNPRASMLLVNRLSNLSDWKFEYNLSTSGDILLSSNCYQGNILSGEKLLDNSQEKQNLIDRFPEAIGGEMEGTGLASISEPDKIDWVIIKGVCDFADGKKAKNKAEFQKVASAASVSLCEALLNEDHALSELNISSCSEVDFGEVLPQQSNLTHSEINLILFRDYSEESEKYYFERGNDLEFTSFIRSYNIWLYGVSGCGKSTTIARNLTIEDYKIVKIFLASCQDDDIISILNVILWKLKKHYNVGAGHGLSGATSESLIAEISKTIKEQIAQTKTVIYFDEIPEYNSVNVFRDFVSALYSINTAVREQGTNNCIFVLSSISSPKVHLHPSQEKIYEQFKFVEMTLWLENDFMKFTRSIIISLQLDFTKLEIENIMKASKNSPRRLKQILRDYLTTKHLTAYNLERIINEINIEKV